MMMPSIFGENLFNDWMDFSFPDVDRKLYGKHVDRIMKTDVREKEDAEEVKIELKNGNLTIHAAKTLDKEEKKEGKYIRQERYSGNMSRSFYVGENVKVQDVQAKFENGILTLDIPKKDPKKPVEENHYVTIM